MWSARWEWQFRWNNLYVGVWRSDWGVWGYRQDEHDGLKGYCLGLGKLLHVAWGELNDPNW